MISVVGIRSVVRAGTVWLARKMSSNPTTDSSPGTDLPSSWAAWSTPKASVSVEVMIAVGGSASAISVRRARSPPAGVLGTGTM